MRQNSSTPSRKRLRVLALVLLVAFLGWQVQQRQARRDAQNFSTRVRPDRLRIGQLTLNACTIGTAHNTTLKAFCTDFPVPENYVASEGRASGRQIKLHVAVVKAETAQPNADLVTFLDGGPGGAATEDYPAVAPAFAELLKQHHVLLIDQRGTGQSQPLDCPQVRQQHPEQETDMAAIKSANFAQTLRDCVTEITRYADPARYTTSDAVRDLESVRKALGSPKLDLIGVSYGTRVAQQYAEQFPQAVRSMVLDSVVPNSLALGQDHARNLEQVLQAQLARCVANAECHARFGDPYQTLKQLHQRLTTPLKVTLNDPHSNEVITTELTASRLVTLVRLYAYNPLTSALLPLVLDEALKGRYAPLLAQEQMLTGEVREQLTEGVGLSVSCSEDQPLLKAKTEDNDTLMGNQLIEYLQIACPIWPHADMPANFHQPLVSGIPTLILAGENDPVTPPRYADEVKASLKNARVLLATQQGHAVLMTNCMPKLVTRFINTLEMRALNARCLDSLHAPPAFLNYNGAAP
jgi:pimeloyl-ACP methyl ester carboxylesterase